MSIVILWFHASSVARKFFETKAGGLPPSRIHFQAILCRWVKFFFTGDIGDIVNLGDTKGCEILFYL